MAAAAQPVAVVPREGDGERRVAATPDSVAALLGLGLEVRVQRGAGAAAGFGDDAYAAAGATVVGDPTDLGPDPTAALVLRVGPPTAAEAAALPRGATVIGLLAPHRHADTVHALATSGVTSLAMELVPRISRAQAMDALSSQANLAGYRAVLVAAARVDKYFPLLMSAAGTLRPAEVVVLGAGVAGLQAIATARRLGAVVHVSDVREAAREEVASLGGRFIDLPQAVDQADAGGYAKEQGEELLALQREVLTERLARAHVAITTAQIPMRPAPLLITRPMLEAMPHGSVVVDLASADGGNCELTEPDREVVHGGVTVVPGQGLVQAMAGEASALYARNVAALCGLLVADGVVRVDPADEVVAGALLTRGGEVVSPRARQALGMPEVAT